MGVTKKMKSTVIKFLPVLCIFMLWFLFCVPYFIKGRIPFPSSYLVTTFPPWNATHGAPVKNGAMPDTISQLYPWKKFTIETWKNGQIPLWNPFSFAGSGHAANYQSAVFSPVNLIFFIFPFIDAWSIQVLLQPLIAGVGMYIFLKALRRSSVASLLGAMSFMFCGFITTWMAYGTLAMTAACLPWILFGITQSYTQKRKNLYRLLVPVFLAFSFFSGHFQIGLYVAFCAIAYTLFQYIIYQDIRNTVLVLVYILSGIGLAAPQLFLTYNAYLHSVRSSSFVKSEVVPWKYLITLFAPDFYGNPVTRNDWFGHYAEWSSYVGIIPLFLSFVAMFGKRMKEYYFFIALAALSLLLAYQSPLNDLLFLLKIPVISTSAASRILILFSFSLCVLSSYGMDELLENWKRKIPVGFYVLCGGFMLFLFVLGLLLFVMNILPPQALQIAKRNSMLSMSLLVFCIGISYAGYIRKYMITNIALALLVLLTMLDMYRYASKWMPFDSRADVYPEEKSLLFLKNTVGVNRVFGNIGTEVSGVFNVPVIEGYDAMYQKRYGEFINATSKGKMVPGERSVVQFDKHGVYRDVALNLLGVKYIYHRKSDGHNIWAFPYWEYKDTQAMKQVYSDEDYWIFENPSVFPRAFLASSYILANTDEKILTALFEKSVNLRETIVLEQKPIEEPNEGEGNAALIVYSPTKVTVKTNSHVSKLLFLSDVFDAGWHAHIDGKNTQVLRADYDFRAVSVPAGSHEVTFSYFPDALRLGVIIAVLSGMILLVGSIWFHYENRIR